MRSHSETADFSACRLDFIETDAPVLSVFGSSAIAPHRVSHFPAGRGADEAAPLEPACIGAQPCTPCPPTGYWPGGQAPSALTIAGTKNNATMRDRQQCVRSNLSRPTFLAYVKMP